MSPIPFWPHALMLIGVVLPIAAAERNVVYLSVVCLAALVGSWTSARWPRTLATERLSQLAVLLAFGYLVAEHHLLDRILVMSLSHFLIVVGIVRLLQARTPREDAQLLVLCLMLLVVGGIVSADILFVVALAAVLSFGLWILVRIHLACEVRGAGDAGASAALAAGPSPAGAAAVLPVSEAALRAVTAGVGVVGVVIGAAVFLVCPRVESSFLRQFHTTAAGPILTGFSPNTDITGGHTISPSERAVMRVRINGGGVFSPEEHESEHYFRGQVSERYGRRAGGLAAGWGWRRAHAPVDPMLSIKLDEVEHRAVLGYTESGQETLQYQIWLERGRDSVLFTPAPVLQISSHDFDEFKFNPRDQLLRVQNPGKLVRYTVTAPSPFATALGKFRSEFEEEADSGPAGLLAPLARADEIHRLIDDRVGETASLDVPANREAFARRLEQFLSSPAFTYTLSPPRPPAGREPISEFLLETRRGHCEYFASAMVVVCQLKGIPARLVTGYRGGEFNPVGGFLVVREKHAHAWVEVLIPGKGWQLFDPTPGVSRVIAPATAWYSPLSSFMDFLQFQWTSLVVAYDAGARRELIDAFWAWVARPARDETNVIGAIAAFVRELFGWRLELSAGDRALYWIFALLVTTLTVLVAYLAAAAGRRMVVVLGPYVRTLRTGAGHVEVEFYDRFCRRLDTLGLRRRADQTPAEFARQLSAAHPALQDAPELVRLYYGQAFGGQSPPPDRMIWIEDFLAAIKRLDRTGLESTPPSAHR